MPPSGLNHRGHELPKKRGPAPGCKKRKSPRELRIEECEKEVSDRLRAMARPMTSEYVVVLACQVFKKKDLQDYYLYVHGPGSGSASSWLTKFKRRWGFKSRRSTRRFRARRNGVELRKELFKCWRRTQAAMKALAGEEDVDYYYANADESGCWAINQSKVLVAREQEDEREDQLTIQNTGEKFSLMFSVTSDSRVRAARHAYLYGAASQVEVHIDAAVVVAAVVFRVE